ncbi:hypothetical protein C9374_011386 [Naegleria lovaniensis]|uniref:Sperm microtubule inner protein 1 C-terminal domain-containing protein n=1 Tax=Naegleria lovaniensis TaxID=51637 RepID=A0AA88KQQ8_NAELO|nr:uncharacterized protein C9374_011386 [Naegleria lovaniensis]KAG2392661.1 hypothetical protein C9374_011386 [Naegleria lovaniensis]
MTEGKKGSAPARSNFLSKHWQESIEKEESIRKQWQQKYHPEKITEEKEMLLKSIQAHAEKEKTKKLRDMSPQRKLLYEGVSKEGGGRASYLKSRREESPTKKNTFPVSSSQEIGWIIEKRFLEGKRSDDHLLATRKGQTKTFYRRDGIGFGD